MARLKTLTINGVTYKVAPPAPVVGVTLLASSWVGSGKRYSQVVSIDGVTGNSKVNLTPSVEQIAIFYDKDITFTTENDGGVVTVYVIGQKPENDYMIPADIVEVACDGGKIYGTTVTTPMNPEQLSPDLTGYATEQWVSGELAEKLGKIQSDIADLQYEAIDISRFTCKQGNTYERGRQLDSLEFEWVLNKGATQQEFNGEDVDKEARSYIYEPEAPLTQDKVFTLTVQDERQAKDTATVRISFLNGVYYGCLGVNDAVNSENVLRLSKNLQSGLGITFPVSPNAELGERPTFACPEDYGTPKFTIGGFEYAWSYLTTFEFTNTYGHKERYAVYQHPQDVTGSMTITVSKEG